MNFILKIFVVLAFASYRAADAQGGCTISDAFLTPGFYNVSQQAPSGFCKEWIVGPITAVKRILVQLPQVNVNCALGDKLSIISDDRTKVFFDLCNPVANQYQNSVLGEGKFVFIRISTTSSRLLSLYFAFYTIDLSTAAPTTATTSAATQSPITTASSRACGVSFYQPNELLRIVGGIEAVAHSWPWQAFLSDGSSMCGATLINNDWVVTAAHCLDGVSTRNLKVQLGSHNIVKTETTRVTKTVSLAIKHELYIGQKNSWDNDIALLKLSSPVTYTNEISPICLPQQGNDLAVIGSTPYVTGWGRVSGFGQTSDVLRQTVLTVQQSSVCGKSLTNNMICAGRMAGTVRDSCDGDSGGPKIMKISNAYYLTGIVSWGSADCVGDGVYTKVSNYIDWIKNKIATN